MKTIVSTIQKEQNQIIRKPEEETIIVQGVAGSGKTSIALHRIAYLLYNKRTLNSNNVLIFSPNKIFSSYISTVLPELGEARTKETNLDQILSENFGEVLSFYKKFENIEKLLKSPDLNEEHKTKSSYGFYVKLNEFLETFFNNCFEPNTIEVKKTITTHNTIKKLFSKSTAVTLHDKLTFIASEIIAMININHPLKFDEENSLKEIIIIKLLKTIDAKNKNILNVYSKFLNTLNLKFNKNAKIDYDDAINLLYIKNYIFGANVSKIINHVVIDELQDYSPIALAIIQQTYPCTKTALGDIYQTVDDEPKLNMLPIATNILNASADPIKLTTAYRSTKQICDCCCKILNLKNINSIKRDGDKVSFIKSSLESQHSIIESTINDLKTKYQSIAVITKNYKECCEISNSLKLKKLSPISQKFKTGIVVSPAYLSKGLEFDCVIVANANDENYKTELDKQQLYVACTRALHKLTIVHVGQISEFLK